MKTCTNPKFYFCKHCGKIIALVNDPSTPTMCCGDVMQEIIPGTVDASRESHVPVIVQKKCTAIVSVGANPHPMTTEHYIQWILLQTNQGIHTRCLKPGDSPTAEFQLQKNEEVIAAYEFCNLHKLWMSNS